MAESKKLQAPLELVEYVAEHGKLPVPNFSAGGIATPADAALVMQLGAEAVFVGSGIFKSSDPEARARAIVKAATYLQRSGEAARSQRRTGRGDAGAGDRQDAGRRTAADARLVMDRKPKIGVLALQGDFEAHEQGARAGGRRAGAGADGGRVGRRRRRW